MNSNQHRNLTNRSKRHKGLTFGLFLAAMTLAACGSQGTGPASLQPMRAASAPSLPVATREVPATGSTDAQSYLNLVDKDSQAIYASSMNLDCSNDTSCIQGLETVDGSVQSMERDLKQTRVPACFASANSELLGVLQEFDTATANAITVVRSPTHEGAQQAISQFDNVAADAQQAQDALDNVGCAGNLV
jgi:hypothetical protein